MAKQNQEYLKKQAEEGSKKKSRSHHHFTRTKSRRAQQHLPQETVEEEEHFADRLPNVKKTRNKRLYRRLAFILTCLGTAILVALYFVSPLSRLSEVTVSGNKVWRVKRLFSSQNLKRAVAYGSSIQKLFFCKYSEKVSNYKKANIKLNGINSFKIDIQEYQIVALLCD